MGGSEDAPERTRHDTPTGTPSRSRTPRLEVTVFRRQCSENSLQDDSVQKLLPSKVMLAIIARARLWAAVGRGAYESASL